MMNYTVKLRRTASAVDPQHEILKSTDDTRRAYGRNVKKSIGDHRFDIVRVWTLKERRNGKWEIVSSNVGRETADKFLNIEFHTEESGR